MSNPSSRTADQLVTGLVDALTALLNANDQIPLAVCTRRAQQGRPCDCRRCAERKARAAIAQAKAGS